MPGTPRATTDWIGIPAVEVNGVRISPIGVNETDPVTSVLDRDHHLGRLDDRDDLRALGKSERSHRLRGDRRHDLLAAIEGHDDLRHDRALADALDGAGELVPCRDFHETPPWADGPSMWSSRHAVS